MDKDQGGKEKWKRKMAIRQKRKFKRDLRWGRFRRCQGKLNGRVFSNSHRGLIRPVVNSVGFFYKPYTLPRSPDPIYLAHVLPPSPLVPLEFVSAIASSLQHSESTDQKSVTKVVQHLVCFSLPSTHSSSIPVKSLFH